MRFKLLHLTIVVLSIAALAIWIAIEWRMIGRGVAIGWLLAISLVVIVIRSFVQRQQRDYVFEPVGPRQIPAEMRQFINEYTPGFLRIGFEALGDYQLLPPPLAKFARYFSSPDDHCFGAIVGQHDVQIYLLFSVLEDGTYIETAPLDAKHASKPRSDKLKFVLLADMPIDELYEYHMAAVRMYCDELGCDVLRFAPEQFREVSHYGHRLASWDLFHQGRKRGPPTPNGSEELPAEAISAHDER